MPTLQMEKLGLRKARGSAGVLQPLRAQPGTPLSPAVLIPSLDRTQSTKGKGPRTWDPVVQQTSGGAAQPSLDFQNNIFENSINHILIILKEIRSPRITDNLTTPTH